METKKLTVLMITTMLFSLVMVPVHAKHLSTLPYDDSRRSMAANAENMEPATLDLAEGAIVITEYGYRQGANASQVDYSGDYSIYQSTSKTDHHIIVESGKINIAIQDLHVEATNTAALQIKEGASAEVRIHETNYLQGGDGFAAISVAAAWDDEAYAPEDSGHIILSGEGILTAVGGDATYAKQIGAGAGIGGNGFGKGNWDGGDFGIVEITDNPTIHAVGGRPYDISYGAGAGIGGGGGEVLQIDDAWHYAGTIHIHGGQVRSYGGSGTYCGAAGIGSGSTSPSMGASYSTDLAIKINGGDIAAYGGIYAAGIGGSCNGESGVIQILGGRVQAYGGFGEPNEPFGGAGIGGGDNGGGDSITIAANASVFAQGGGAAAGIGGGCLGYVDNIEILDHANVTAIGGNAVFWGGAGIGGGDYSGYTPEENPFGAVTLNTTGNIVAYGGAKAQAIGLGSYYPKKMSYPITIGETSGPIWMLNADQTLSAVHGIHMDHTISLDELILNQRSVFWHHGTTQEVSGNAHFFDGVIHDSKDYQWSAKHNKLTIKQGDKEIISYEYDARLHDAYDNWALIIQEDHEPEVGDLAISHVMEDTSADTEKLLHITVILKDPSINGTYHDMVFKDGIATFTLKPNEKKTAVGLPANIAYGIKTAKEDHEGYTITAVNDHGTIIAGSSVAAIFTSKKRTEQPVQPEHPTQDDGYLTASLWFTDGSYDENTRIPFTVTLDDASIHGTYGDMTFTNGTAVFTLQHGEKKTAKLPAGIRYRLTIGKIDGYIFSSTDTQGTIESGKTAAVWITTHRAATSATNVPQEPLPANSSNHTAQVVQTGDPTNTATWMILCMVSACGIVLICRKKTKRNA